MSLIFTIFAAIFAIFVVVIVHELGHLLVAKAVGVKVERFSIGFGKVLFSIRGKETEYVVSLLPLGGYVKMLGEGDDNIPPDQLHRAYDKKPVLSRMAIVLAGPITNFITAIIVLWALILPGVTHVKPIIGQVTPQSIAAKGGLKSGDQIIKVGKHNTYSWQQVMMAIVMRVGEKGILDVKVKRKPDVQSLHQLNLNQWELDPRKPDILGSLGLTPYFPKVPPVISQIQSGSPAAKAGLQAGDLILSIDNQPVDDWMKISKDIKKRPDQKIQIRVKRNSKIILLTAKTGVRTKKDKSEGYLGVAVKIPSWPKEMLYQVNYTFFTAWPEATARVWQLTKFNGIVLYRIIAGKISPKTLGGPVSIFQMAGQASNAGWVIYFGFVAFISVTLGFVNLLPIPGLDGGHFLFLLIEGVIRRPLPLAIQYFLIRVGILLLILLIVYATFNDVLRIF